MCSDVESLFTNVPIKTTINVVLTRTYNEHAISTNLKKRSLKKLTLDKCTKMAFSFNNIIYERLACYGQYYYDRTRKESN